jgi:hypothetical protein
MKKNALILIAVLAALLLVWWWLGQRESARQRGDVPEVATNIDTLTVDRFVLTRYGQPTLVFEKDIDGFWNMVEPVQDRANPSLTRQLERGLALMTFTDKISSRKAQYAAFEIDDTQATRLQAYAGDDLQADIYIGKLAPDRAHVYVRPAGENSVYTATGGGAFNAMRRRATDDFRDRTVFNFDPSAYDSITVTGADFFYGIARADSASWNVRIGSGAYQDADSPVTESLLHALGQLKATGFLPDSVEVNWDRSALAIHAWRLGGGTDDLEFQPVEGETNYWVRVEGRPHVYKVFESAFKTFHRDPTTVRATGPAGT